MKKKSVKKLSLSRETVIQLDAFKGAIVGGDSSVTQPGITVSCGDSCDCTFSCPAVDQ